MWETSYLSYSLNNASWDIFCLSYITYSSNEDKF